MKKIAPIRIDRFTLLAEIASGGMATVYYARMDGVAGFNRSVAIKRLHPHLAKNPEFASMLIDEANLATRIQHPNVVQTLDILQQEEELLLVMEHVRGHSLSSIVRRTKETPWPVAVTASIVRDALEGLNAVHAACDSSGAPLNIIHRDISPQNLIVGNDGITRVLDFGIAKASQRLHTTRDGQVKGKIAYMPPEHIKGEHLDQRVDVFAMGVVLWELLTGTRLFHGESDVATIHRVVNLPIPLAADVNPEVTPALEQVVQKALARDANLRWETAAAFSLALEHAVPLVATREIASFSREVIGSVQLEQEEALLRAMESSTRSAPAKAVQEEVAIDESTTRIASAVSTAAAAPRTSTRGRVLLALGTCALLGGSVGVYRMVRTVESVATPATAASAPASTSAAPIPYPTAQANAADTLPQAPQTSATPTRVIKALPTTIRTSATMLVPPQPRNTSAKGIDGLLDNRK
jgi:eukaryotic-like serine/threonine-protein kinase